MLFNNVALQKSLLIVFSILAVAGAYLNFRSAYPQLSSSSDDIAEQAVTDAQSADDRIFTSLFACADHPGNGINERLVMNLAGVYRTQGLDQLKNVMGGSDYRKYCFLDGTPFPAVALRDQNIIQSWTEWNGEGVYVVKATEKLSFAVVYP
jgi:hypothetical protein